jgi:signal peptidase II
VSDATIAPPRRRWTLVVAVAALVVAIDQLTKWWALNALATRRIHLVWTLQLALTRNTGAAFSVAGGRGPIIALLALGVVGVVLWQGTAARSRLGAVAIGLVLGGALGNLVDRAFRSGGGGFLSGAVIDFIDLQWWPVFNIADSAVVIGAILLVAISLLRPDGPRPRGGDHTAAGAD